MELETGSRFYGHDLYHLLASRAVDAYNTMRRFDEDSLMLKRIEGIRLALVEAYKQRLPLMKKRIRLMSLRWTT